MVLSMLKVFGIDPGARARARRQARRQPSPPPEPIVRPLSTTRPQSLTDLPGDTQEQSRFIRRIPVELRLMIWDLVLSAQGVNRILHLEPADGIVRYSGCSEADDCDKLGFRHRCWGTTIWSKEECDRLRDSAGGPLVFHGNLLSLLLTCRLIYRESVEILYQANTFDLRRTDTILRLPSVMLQDRLRCIRSIQFSTVFQCPPPRVYLKPSTPVSSGRFRMPDDVSKWPDACDVLASFPHLDELHIVIALWSRVPVHRLPTDDESMLYVLVPLKALRAARFTVTLTERVNEEVQLRLGPAPFEILTRERPGIGYFVHATDD